MGVRTEPKEHERPSLTKMGSPMAKDAREGVEN